MLIWIILHVQLVAVASVRQQYLFQCALSLVWLLFEAASDRSYNYGNILLINGRLKYYLTYHPCSLDTRMYIVVQTPILHEYSTNDIATYAA